MKEGKSNMIANISLFLLVVCVVLMVIIQVQLYQVSKLGAVATSGKSSGPDVKNLAAGAVKVDFYIMSKCPYGIQVENGIKPVLDKLGNNVDFSINYIADFDGTSFRSLHGDTEVKGDIVTLCAAKYNPTKYMDMVICMAQNSGGIPDNWEGCATGLNIDKIKACYTGAEGQQMLKDSIAKSQAVQATGSPTMYVNGKLYNGQRDAQSFMSAICSSFASKPAACSGVADLPSAAAPTQGGCG